MLIFGWRVYFRTIGYGTLHCHRCGGDRQYRHRVGRWWIYLLLIPVIPLGRDGEHVQCTTCRTRYRMGVLALPTVAQMQAALPAGMRAAATVMVRAGDAASAPARRRAVEAIRGAGLADYDDSGLTADLERAASPDYPLDGALSSLAVQLAVEAREWFLAEVVRVGLADGPLTEDERHMARDIAARLGMTAAQAHGVILLTEEGATAE
jgi:uncharacterized tellurite resistance protein B-like protein